MLLSFICNGYFLRDMFETKKAHSYGVGAYSSPPATWNHSGTDIMSWWLGTTFMTTMDCQMELEWCCQSLNHMATYLIMGEDGMLS